MSKFMTDSHLELSSFNFEITFNLIFYFLVTR